MSKDGRLYLKSGRRYQGNDRCDGDLWMILLPPWHWAVLMYSLVARWKVIKVQDVGGERISASSESVN